MPTFELGLWNAWIIFLYWLICLTIFSRLAMASVSLLREKAEFWVYLVKSGQNQENLYTPK